MVAVSCTVSPRVGRVSAGVLASTIVVAVVEVPWNVSVKVMVMDSPFCALRNAVGFVTEPSLFGSVITMVESVQPAGIDDSVILVNKGWLKSNVSNMMVLPGAESVPKRLKLVMGVMVSSATNAPVGMG